MACGRLLPLLLLLPAAAALGARPGPTGLPLLELCSLPKVVGRCRASMLRWWFNVTAGSCQSFTFGGCDGNANNFLTERECQESCVLGAAPTKPDRRAKPPDADPTYAEHCAVPRLTGPCRASFLRWYYSPANGTCRQFIYGGCRGNKNNFESEEECLKRCGPKPENTSTDFHSNLSTNALALGVLLVMLAAVLLGYITDVTLKMCQKKPAFPGVGRAWNPEDDKEYLMSNPL